MPLAPNNHTYLQMAGVCCIHLDAQACQRVYSAYPLLDEGSALLLLFHSPYREELMKWMERYNTLHNQCGSPWDLYFSLLEKRTDQADSTSLSTTFLEKNTLKPPMYLSARLLETVFHVQFLGCDLHDGGIQVQLSISQS